MHPKCKNLLHKLKTDDLFTRVQDKDYNIQFEEFNGIRIVPSYNFLDGTEEAVTV